MQVLLSRALTLPPRSIFAVGNCHLQMLHERHVVDHDNNGGGGHFSSRVNCSFTKLIRFCILPPGSRTLVQEHMF